jgi:hypothetical protein
MPGNFGRLERLKNVFIYAQKFGNFGKILYKKFEFFSFCPIFWANYKG